MLYNYFLIAWRNFRRQRFFSLLNMFGLALGLASAIFIFLYVSDELQYDRMHPHFADTYRVGNHFTRPDGREFYNVGSPGFWVERLSAERPEVVKSCRIEYIGYPTSLHHKETDKIVLTEEIKWAEPGFESVLQFELLRGDPDRMFDNHQTIVLSETGATNLFGDKDPMGETISVKHPFATDDVEIDVEVTGIYRDYPDNSHFKPEYLLNLNALRSVRNDWDFYTGGTRFSNEPGRFVGFFENYIVLQPGADPRPVAEALHGYARQMQVQSDSGTINQDAKWEAYLMPLPDLHYDTNAPWEGNDKGNKQYLAIFSAIAFLIMLIACINYMNLATARSAKRAREVGLRKTFGSDRREITQQFFMESFLTTVGALVIAVLLVFLFLKPFNELAEKSFTMGSLFNPWMLGITAGVVVLMAVLSGLYPALYLSGFRPVDVLKGQIVKGKAAELMKKGLVAVQYAVALVLLICTLVVIRQMSHLQGSQLNEHGDQLLSIRYGGTAPSERFPTFKQTLLQDKDIELVTLGNHMPRLDYFGFVGFQVKFPDLSPDEMDWNHLNVEYDFPKTFGIEIIAGRDFEAASISDSSAVLVNQAAVQALGRPVEEVLGSTLIDMRTDEPLRVVGIVKDFPFESMHQAIEPLVLELRPHQIDQIAYVKLPAGKFQEKINTVERVWREVFPNTGFDYWFVSDEFNRMYISERRVASLSKVFVVLAILITALGVFGLASYTAEQKTKEVGIRKVLGAEITQVVGLFIWMFVKIFLVASLFALPAAYLLTRYWLKDFSYQVNVGPGVYIGSLAGLLLLTFVTVGVEVWKAARVNPVVSLRSE